MTRKERQIIESEYKQACWWAAHARGSEQQDKLAKRMEDKSLSLFQLMTKLELWSHMELGQLTIDGRAGRFGPSITHKEAHNG